MNDEKNMIQIDENYYLYFEDRLNISLIKRTLNTRKDSKTYGQMVESVQGYYSTLKIALEAYFKKVSFDNSAKNVQELFEFIQQIDKKIDAFCASNSVKLK